MPETHEMPVSSRDLTQLRTSGLINENETAILVGDVVVAEDVVTKNRRVIDYRSRGLMLESTRRVLKG